MASKRRFIGLASWLSLTLVSTQALGQAGAPPGELTLPQPELRYPVKHAAAIVRDAYDTPMEWDGRFLAIQGTIKTVVTNSRGQPNFELTLDDGETSIWLIWALRQQLPPFLTEGSVIRAAGWLRNSQEMESILAVKLPRQQSLLLASVCLVDGRNFNAIFDKKYAEYCEGWRRGLTPPDMAHAKP